MSRLLRLYPPAWRDRYGDELLALLADHPPSLRDRIDIVRGAVDARIHPQVVAAEGDQEGGVRMITRVAGLAAIAGGAMWAAGGISMNATAVNPSLGYKDGTAGLTAVALAMLLVGAAALLASRRAAHDGRAPVVGALGLIAGAVLTPFPWPIMFLGFFLGLAGAATFGFATYRAGGRPTAALVGAAAIGMLLFNTEDGRALLTVPYGLAWGLLGLDLILRPRPAARSAPRTEPAAP